METVRAQIVDWCRARDAESDRVFSEIAGAADMDAALKAVSTPSLFVVRTGTKRIETGHNTDHHDIYQLFFSVRNVASTSGADSSDEAERLSGLVADWLDDFEPEVPERFMSLNLRQGRAYSWTDQLLVWGDTYELIHVTRSC